MDRASSAGRCFRKSWAGDVDGVAAYAHAFRIHPIEKLTMTKRMNRFATIAFLISGAAFCALGLLRSDLLFGGVGVSFLGTAGMYFCLGRGTAEGAPKESPIGTAQQADARAGVSPRR